MLTFSIYLTFLFINFILTLNWTPHHRKEDKRSKKKFKIKTFDHKKWYSKKKNTLSTTPTCNFDATKLFFIYFVIYSFNDGNFFKDIL